MTSKTNTLTLVAAAGLAAPGKAAINATIGVGGEHIMNKYNMPQSSGRNRTKENL